MHREAKQKHNNAADKQSDKDKEEEGTIYTHWAGWEHKKGGMRHRCNEITHR